MSHRCLAILMFLALILCGPVHAASVGWVTRLAGEAEIEAPTAKNLAAGDSVTQGDIIVTHKDARLELHFIDGMVLTLGEEARMVIDALVFDPAAAKGQVALKVNQGAFRVITGGIAKLPDHPFHLVTPFASIGVRGTDFWGGPLVDPFAMVTLDGVIEITTPAGTTVLNKGQGIEIKTLGGGTTAPHVWSPEKTLQAVRTVSFP